MFIKKKVIAKSRQDEEHKKRKFENMDRRNTLTVSSHMDAYGMLPMVIIKT